MARNRRGRIGDRPMKGAGPMNRSGSNRPVGQRYNQVWRALIYAWPRLAAKGKDKATFNGWARSPQPRYHRRRRYWTTISTGHDQRSEGSQHTRENSNG
jgi:hypothetical protein